MILKQNEQAYDLRITFQVFISISILLFSLVSYPCEAQKSSVVVSVNQSTGLLHFMGATPIMELKGTPEQPKMSRPQYESIELEEIITELAVAYKLDPNFVKAVAKAESNFQTNAVSPRGAMGVMQLTPDTAKKFGVLDPFDAEQNIEGGIKYLSHLMQLFSNNYEFVLAAYHCGENRVLSLKGIPKSATTLKFISRTKELYKEFNGGKELRSRTVKAIKDNAKLQFTNMP